MNVTVPVRSALLMPEPHGMHQLVDDNSCVNTAISQGHLVQNHLNHLWFCLAKCFSNLLPVPTSPHRAAAPTALHDVDEIPLIRPWNKLKENLHDSDPVKISNQH